MPDITVKVLSPLLLQRPDICTMSFTWSAVIDLYGGIFGGLPLVTIQVGITFLLRISGSKVRVSYGRLPLAIRSLAHRALAT